MNMASLGVTGNIGGVVTGIILVLVLGVLALTFAPNILVAANGMYTEGIKAGKLGNEERITRLAKRDGTDNADTTWKKAEGNSSLVFTLAPFTADGLTCSFDKEVNQASGGDISYFTPKGTLITMAQGTASKDWADSGTTCQTSLPADSTTGIGGLWTLLIQVVGLVMMIGPITFLSFMAASWLRSANIGGAMSIGVIIAVVIGVVVIGETLSTLFAPLDVLVDYVSGPRLDMFQSGIGNIARTLSNFYVVGLAAGLIPLGQMFWRSKMGSGSGRGGV